MKKIKFILLILFSVKSFLSISIANATTSTSTMNVSSSVATSCSISIPAALNFGSFTGAQLDASANIMVNCTNGVSYSIYLNAGANGGTVSTRKMISGSNTLNYTIYSNTGRTTLWQDGTGSYVSSTGTGSGVIFIAYGRIIAVATPFVGSYTDTITATLNF